MVIYHGQECPDGFAAAFAAWKRFGDTIQYIPLAHGPGMQVPDVTGKHVVVVDFSFNTAVTEALISVHKFLIKLVFIFNEFESRPILEIYTRYS